MGSRGPKPTPTSKLSARGSWRAKINPNEPEAAISAPTCPSFLGKNGRREWRRVVKILVSSGVMTDLDRGILAKYCSAWERVLAAAKIIDEDKQYVRRNGEKYYLSPAVKLLEQAFDQMEKAARELGMTPSSRSRVQVTKGSKDDGKQGKQRFFGAG